jgi:hypothetical protein
LLYRKASTSALLSMSEEPVIWPLALMAFPALVGPPRVPRSIIEPLLYRIAC